MNTEREEISCSQCFDLLSVYVDAELSGSEMGAELAKVEQHLNQCQVCMEEYEILHDLVGHDLVGLDAGDENTSREE